MSDLIFIFFSFTALLLLDRCQSSLGCLQPINSYQLHNGQGIVAHYNIKEVGAENATWTIGNLPLQRHWDPVTGKSEVGSQAGLGRALSQTWTHWQYITDDSPPGFRNKNKSSSSNSSIVSPLTEILATTQPPMTRPPDPYLLSINADNHRSYAAGWQHLTDDSPPGIIDKINASFSSSTIIPPSTEIPTTVKQATQPASTIVLPLTEISAIVEPATQPPMTQSPSYQHSVQSTLQQPACRPSRAVLQAIIQLSKAAGDANCGLQDLLALSVDL